MHMSVIQISQLNVNGDKVKIPISQEIQIIELVELVRLSEFVSMLVNLCKHTSSVQSCSARLV